MKGIISRGKFQLTVNERSLTTFLGKLKRSGGASIDQPRRVVQKIWRKSSDPAVQSRYSRRENSNWFLARSRFRLSVPLSLSLSRLLRLAPPHWRTLAPTSGARGKLAGWDVFESPARAVVRTYHGNHEQVKGSLLSLLDCRSFAPIYGVSKVQCKKQKILAENHFTYPCHVTGST